ncbi:unnamed protein product [Linum trigynum]|uniref:Integrase catalytic domain-containing protein n=1 Tax=Linum trigynum TaxID=586398 RepID=A0AAV2CBR0_9ROSI
MDFIIGLPKVDGCGCIMVVVDRFSKYGVFIPGPKDLTAGDAARLFFKNVVKYWGIPSNIVSDRDGRFTGRFWRELFKIMGSNLNFSTAFHPQSDGQTERVNALLEVYLRYYVSANQRDWVKLMDTTQFSYNLHRNESTNTSPFELAMGQQPLTPTTVATGYRGNSPAAYKFAKGWHEKMEMAKSYLARATKKMKKWADKKRRHLEFEEGDMVMVKFYPHRFKHLKNVHKGLLRRYEGPFPIVKRIGKVAYKVEVPSHLEIHLVFHVSQLKASTKTRRTSSEESCSAHQHSSPRHTTMKLKKSWRVVSFLVVAYIQALWSTWSSGATFRRVKQLGRKSSRFGRTRT